MLLRTFDMSAKVPVQSVKRFETIHLGRFLPRYLFHFNTVNHLQ